MWPKVNKALLPMKGHYFLFNAGTAPVQPFMPVYAKHLGFSSVVVGVIYSILPVTGMIAKPFFGAIADRFRLHKFIFLLFQVVTIISFFSIQFIPEVPVEQNSQIGLVCGPLTNFHVDVSDVHGKCILERINAEIEAKKTVKCRMKCAATPQLLNEICYPWKAKIPLCMNSTSAASSKNVISEYANISSKKSKLTELGKDAYAEKFKSNPSKESYLYFNATVLMEHTEEIMDRMYFRVSKVVFDDDVTTHIAQCSQKINANCSISCADSSLAGLISSKEDNNSENVVNMYQFWLLLLFLVTSWIGMSVVASISDAICFEILGAKANLYGNQRLWGSIGWGSFAFLTGILLDEFSKGLPKKNYTPAFYLMLVMLASDILCSYSLKYQQTKLSTQIVKNVGRLLQNIKIDIFLMWCIFVGMCTGVQWNFLYWYIEELVGKNCDVEDWMKTLEGLVSIVQCFLGELPAFFASGWILKKFGHINVMTGILGLIGVRFILYSYVTNPWWCLPIEILQSTLGLSFATMASYASIVAPPGTEATVQGLVGAVFEGIGVSLGSLLGGFFFKNFSGAICFRIFGIASLVAWFLHGLVQYLLTKTAGFSLDGKGEKKIKDVTKDPEVVDAGERMSQLDDRGVC